MEKENFEYAWEGAYRKFVANRQSRPKQLVEGEADEVFVVENLIDTSEKGASEPSNRPEEKRAIISSLPVVAGLQTVLPPREEVVKSLRQTREEAKQARGKESADVRYAKKDGGGFARGEAIDFMEAKMRPGAYWTCYWCGFAVFKQKHHIRCPKCSNRPKPEMLRTTIETIKERKPALPSSFPCSSQALSRNQE